MDELQADFTYTAIITVNTMDSGEMRGVWWWNDITSNGEQYNRTFSLQPGCYVIETSLYERDDFNTDVNNATVRSQTQSEMVVGNGACVDGLFVEDVVSSNETEGVGTNEDQEANDALPGLGLPLTIVSTAGALFVLRGKDDDA